MVVQISLFAQNIKTLKIEEFNKTSDKSYLFKDFIKADRDDAKEITKYMINKKIEYKKYFMDDLVKESMIKQEKYSKLIDDKIKVDDKYVNISDYIKADLEKEALSLIEDITDKMSDLITRAKYSVITYYYDELFNRTVDEYLNDKKIKIWKTKVRGKLHLRECILYMRKMRRNNQIMVKLTYILLHQKQTGQLNQQ